MTSPRANPYMGCVTFKFCPSCGERLVHQPPDAVPAESQSMLTIAQARTQGEEMDILALLRSTDFPMTAREIADRLGLKGVSRPLKRLVRKRRVEVVEDRKKDGIWPYYQAVRA